MTQDDVETFAGLLVDVFSAYPNAKPLGENQAAIFFRALADYPIEVVRYALDAHVRASKFPPAPADVLEQIRQRFANDGRPGPEEAWASCLPGRDENITIIWTTEMREAWGVAMAVLREGDEVGARMAFKEAYSRLVSEARSAQRPIEWHESPGHDKKQRAVAIAEAQRLGRLGYSESLPVLPAPEGDAVAAEQRLLALQGGVGAPPEIREKLAKIRDELTAAADGPTPAQADLEELQRRKDAALAMVMDHLVDPPPLPIDTPASEVLRRLDEQRMQRRAEAQRGGDDRAS